MTQIVFLSHLSRTGSTLLARELTQSSSICAVPEGALPGELYGLGSGLHPFTTRRALDTYLSKLLTATKLESWRLDIPDLSRSARLPMSGPGLISHLLSAYVREHGEEQTAAVLHKGDPVMPWAASQVLRSFPGAKMILSIRDPRAVYVSQRAARKALPGSSFARSSAQSAYEWRRAALATESMAEVNRTAVVRYEDLLVDPGAVVAAIRLELGLSARLGRLEGVDIRDFLPAAERETIHRNVGTAPDLSRSQGWRSEIRRSDLTIIENIVGSHMERLGYSRLTRERSELLSGAARLLGRSACLQDRLSRRTWDQLSVRLRESDESHARSLGVILSTLKPTGVDSRRLRRGRGA